MLIAAVDVDLVPLPAVAPSFAWRRGLRGSAGARETAVLRITTESGAVGEAYHEWSGPMLADIVDRVLREELVGERADRREWLWHRLWELDRTEEFPIWLIGVIDVALWDLEARVLGVPVHRLLGTYRESIPAYASTTTFATIEEYLDIADQCLELGFPAIKLHGWGDARADADLCQRLRAHSVPTSTSCTTARPAFDLPNAEYLGRALGEAGYRWYEEPMREFSITAYRWLADRVEVPLLVGETSDGSHLNTADFIASGCATYVRTSANHRGGITGAMRIAHLADSFRLRAEVHGPTEPAVHLCMAIPNCTYYESLVTSNPATRESRVGPDGLVHAPEEPGIALPDFATRVPRPTRAQGEDVNNETAQKGAHMKVNRRWLALVPLVVVAAAALAAASTGGASTRAASGSITVWVDAVRLPVAKLYAKTHRKVHVNIVTFDGDANGATTLQTKIQLWNRTGNGWPDVIFTEQANDPVWMSQPPFNYAMNLKGVFPASLLKGWPAPSLAQCTVTRRLVCLQDNLAQEVLYVNKKLMSQFGYQVPTTWQQWAALGVKVAKDHPGYIIGTLGDSFGAWLYLWPDRCPISQVVAGKTVRINSADVIAPGWRACSIRFSPTSRCRT